MRQKQEIQLTGFAPDLDPATPGVMSDCCNMVPSLDGFKPMRGAQPIGLAALPSACRGGVVVKRIDNGQRFIVGTQTGLYEATGSNWTDVSRSGGYIGGPETRWRFAQFGNDTFACNKADDMQKSNNGAFANVGDDAPKAAILESCSPGFIMAFDTNDGINDLGDGWWCSALNNPSDWNPSIATQSANGRLIETPGPIRAGEHYQGDYVRNSTPAELGSTSSKYIIMGWVCVASGTPGTWQECRTLTGN